jgi:hypothetical protein
MRALFSCERLRGNSRSPRSDDTKLGGGRDHHVYVITPDNLWRSLHFDVLALERPWLGGPSDLTPHGDRDDHRQHLVTAPFARRELKENRLTVPHPAVTDCAVDKAHDVYRAGDRAIIGRVDPAQRDRREAPCPGAGFAVPNCIDPDGVCMLCLE